MNDLETVALEYTRLRKERDNAKAYLQGLEEKLRDTCPEIFADMAYVAEQLAALNAQISEFESMLKTLALEEYKATKDKKPYPGVEVKVFKKILFSDRDAALEAAKAMPGMTETAFTDGFDKYIKSITPGTFPHASWTEDPRVQISSKFGED